MKIRNKLIKLGLSAIMLVSLANKANSGILYYQNQIKQNVKLEQVVEKIKQKYPKKQLEYSSRGFLQFKDFEIIEDKEINNLIQKLNKEPNKIEGINFYDNSTIMIDSEPHHIGDGRKDWYPIKQDPEAVFYEKKFNIENIKDMKNPRLALEAFSSDSDNEIYLNGKFIGLVPNMPKKNWGKLIKKYKEQTPFIYGELPVSEYLKQGENIIKIESKESGWIFKSYDDFMIRGVQIVYNEK